MEEVTRSQEPALHLPWPVLLCTEHEMDACWQALLFSNGYSFWLILYQAKSEVCYTTRIELQPLVASHLTQGGCTVVPCLTVDISLASGKSQQNQVRIGKEDYFWPVLWGAWRVVQPLACTGASRSNMVLAIAEAGNYLMLQRFEDVMDVFDEYCLCLWSIGVRNIFQVATLCPLLWWLQILLGRNILKRFHYRWSSSSMLQNRCKELLVRDRRRGRWFSMK